MTVKTSSTDQGGRVDYGSASKLDSVMCEATAGKDTWQKRRPLAQSWKQCMDSFSSTSPACTTGAKRNQA
jgi:hypothetical protein